MKPNNEEESCYVCYGLHYLSGQMRMNGEKAQCFGLSVKAEPNVGLIEMSRKVDKSLKPNIRLYSLGKSNFTGKMHRLGTPPICQGVQLSVVQQGDGHHDETRHDARRQSTGPNNAMLPKPEPLSSEEWVLRIQDAVVLSCGKLVRSIRYTTSSFAEDLPEKVVRNSAKLIRSTVNTGSSVINFVLRSVGWK